MLSKLLTDAAVDIRPLVLRRYALSSAGNDGADPSPDNDAPSDVISKLRAAVSDLTIRSSEQARQAHDAGYRAGEAAAKHRFEAEVRSIVEKLGAAAADVAETRAQVIRRAEADTVRLAVEIARRALHRELSTDVSAVESLVKAALQKLQSQEVYRVRVHPDQEALVKTCLEQAGRSQGVEVIGDPLQSRGGVLFEIAGGVLDASVETQVSEIERGLTEQLKTRV